MNIIDKIKAKKELSGIPDSIVLELIKKHNFNPLSEKDEKIVIKEIRRELRNYVGRFKAIKNPEKLIEQNKIEEILKSHSSTRERLNFYKTLKETISSLNPKSILDLGCGLNPLALADKRYFYYASDIDEKNLELIQLFFKKSGIKGKTFISDLRKIPLLPKADLCLILKVIDILKLSHKKVEDLIKSLECNIIIVSFSTVTLSGKPMNNKKRQWFETLIKKIGYTFKILNYENEIFYIIKKLEQEDLEII
ncbi:hypothetical protein AUJ84_00485 [Candidatus Pacearchaeota archaeon CG1_02_32_132]|nr:MAG: hypothetical protein AUJ84_00485 [Candidatus Pacearchaeota archaeon CG1_02_32_132]